MRKPTRPNLPLPEPIRGSDGDTFASFSVRIRLAEIARRMLEENDFSPAVVRRLNDLITEISEGVIRQLTDRSAPDADKWRTAISGYLQHEWISVPWFFAESYFYRRILEATGYFRRGEGWGKDPFRYQKRLGLETNREALKALSARLERWVSEGWSEGRFAQLLAIDLWGNQADLSLWPAGKEGHPGHGDSDEQKSHLLIDDSPQVLTRLSDISDPLRVDFLIDNAGFELVCDLCLADFLLSCDMSTTVHFNLKIHPTFVSDATVSDVGQTLSFLAAGGHRDMRAIAGRIRRHLETGRLKLDAHPHWTSPDAAWKMPDELYRRLAFSHLTISKGDANYRRLLGDRRWPYMTPFHEILSYFPSAIVALRTFKSEVAAGISQHQLEALTKVDATWMTNGKWGIIQFASAS